MKELQQWSLWILGAASVASVAFYLWVVLCITRFCGLSLDRQEWQELEELQTRESKNDPRSD